MNGRFGGAVIRRRALGVVAAVLLLASPVAARPGVEESVARVKELVTRLGADPPPSEREALLDESIGVRGDLIVAAGQDERAASWMLDQAEALLQRAGRDGAEWSVLYGVATGSQRARMGDAAAQAATLIDRARRAIEETVERLEAELFAARENAADAGRISAVIEPRLSVLLDVEQAWRVPMLGARTALLKIASEEGGVRPMERRAQAAGVAADLDGLPTPDDEGDAARLVQLGTAYLLAGENAAAGDQFHAAEGVAGASVSAKEQARLGRVAAAMSLSAARELSKGLLASQDSTPLLLALVRAEVAARAVLLQAPASGAARISVQRDALAGLAAVIRRVIQENAGVAASVRELSMQKVAAVTGPGRAWGQVDVAAMEPAIVYARGMTMVGSDEGCGLLRLVVTGDGPADVREAAMWALGTRTAEGDGSRFEAASMLMRLLREFPSSVHAPAAFVRADVLLRSLMGSRRDEVLALQRELIELASRNDLSVEARAELGSLAAANHALDEDSGLDAAALERMLERLASWPEGEAPRRSADEQNVSIVVDRALRRAESPGARAAIARVGAAWASEAGSGLAARFRLALAEALLESGDGKGSIEAVGAIGRLEGAALSDAERIRARVTLGRAQRASGDEGAAFATLRGLADELDVEGSGRSGRDPAFWAAWAEMLEILRSQNGDGARSATIRLQVNRLKLIDPGLGGGSWRERILKVESSLE